MSGISIPGVSDKYKTNDLVNSLVEVEKLPLKREQEKLETYKAEQANWRRVNQYMSSLRESTRSLYSFNNPFNERIAESSDERAITATAEREATVETFKIDVEQIATADRFLSGNIDKNTKIPEGTYQFKVGEKIITYRFKGGKISDSPQRQTQQSAFDPGAGFCIRQPSAVQNQFGFGIAQRLRCIGQTQCDFYYQRPDRPLSGVGNRTENSQPPPRCDRAAHV